MAVVVPHGACDCHAHVFGPLDRFPFIEERGYTPAETLPGDYRAMLASLGVDRGVIVQPSVFGTDNGATLSAIAELGADFRGVAVLPPDVEDAELVRCAAGGIRGTRLSDLTRGGVPLAHLEAMAARLKGSGWHIQIFAAFSTEPDLPARIRTLGVPVVIDHLGLLDPRLGTADPAFRAVLELLRDGLCWMKLSGPYISSQLPAPHADIEPLVAAIVDAAPGRLVWGTDWPHPSAGDAVPADADLLDLLGRWVPDTATRHRILVDNPAALYGFPPP
jgi:predicted TIM-barrel fold metal-dependent hydrolase